MSLNLESCNVPFLTLISSFHFVLEIWRLKPQFGFKFPNFSKFLVGKKLFSFSNFRTPLCGWTWSAYFLITITYLIPFSFHLLLISAPFNFRPFNFRPLGKKSHISPPLIFVPFQTGKNFNTKFPDLLPLYFAPPRFKGFKIRSLQFSPPPPSRRKLKGDEIWREQGTLLYCNQ